MAASIVLVPVNNWTGRYPLVGTGCTIMKTETTSAPTNEWTGRYRKSLPYEINIVTRD